MYSTPDQNLGAILYRTIIAEKVCHTIQMKATLCDEHRAHRKYGHIKYKHMHHVIETKIGVRTWSIMHTLTDMQFESEKLFQQ